MLARKTSLTGLPGGGVGGGSLTGGLTVGAAGGGGVSGSASQSTGIDPLAAMTGNTKSDFLLLGVLPRFETTILVNSGQRSKRGSFATGILVELVNYVMI